MVDSYRTTRGSAPAVRWKKTSNESEIVSKKKAKKQKESSDTPDTGLKNKANTSKQTRVS